MKKYQAILLDLDNTLYDYVSAHEAALQAFSENLITLSSISVEQAKTAYMQARKQVHQRLQGTAASHHRLLYMQNVCEQLQLNSARFALSLQDAYWQAFLAHMKLFSGAREFLQRWRVLGKRIALVTDLTAEIQFQKLEKLQLQDAFDYLVISEEVGVDKPDPKMFLTALEKLQLEKKDVLMIGDDFVKDIQGARAIGIDAWLFSPNAENINGEASVNFKSLMKLL